MTTNVPGRKLKVIGGRDHHLLELIANKMNFKFQYVDPRERTQGSSVGSERKSLFTGGLGMIQNREAHFLFGDVGLSWERRKAAEFSFFTLVDSGAFATHAPRRLNEALAVVRPFQANVWPYLILTVLLSGPMFYFVIAMPYFWETEEKAFEEVRRKCSIELYPEYINEITLVKPFKHPRKDQLKKKMPKNLFSKCTWFTVQLFLKQSCSEPYNGMRARFLIIVYWVAATYVLSDVYSAQLTSFFARPARESPIDTLSKLEYAMEYRGYQLFIEKDSSVLEMLENSTEIFRRLYKLMKQRDTKYEGFLINSIEEGIQRISNGAENVILGGRETLYFNIKRYGINNFQLSQQLYTRYSAVAMQIGCPFLESFNKVIIHLFEGGIMDKITNSEYEKMLAVKDLNRGSEGQFKKNENKQKYSVFDSNPQPINLRMLQGAFIILLFGNTLAATILLIEISIYENNIALYVSILNAIRSLYVALRKLAAWLLQWIQQTALPSLHL
ncbi:unnamed protein product [Hermetia illucens]|uniref:Ionotropic glutamate receptor C-terminal domain-containing protein n=2 Tax=Hermetia illucens TaxID=343691 RepID=A0A7R8UNZ2_HERIL|nr:unnamed protein product [Hermetia illucens]